MRIVIFVFISSTLYSFSFAQSAQPRVFCQYGGELSKEFQGNNFTFSVDDIPTRCDEISYGGTFFNSSLSEEDAKAISELKKAGYTVYTMYMNLDDNEWVNIISSTDPTVLDNYIAPMLIDVNKNEIDGVILSYIDFFTGQISDYTNKMAGFLCRIKECAPNLKISILVHTHDPTNYGNTELFDFAVINSLVDIYFIDTSIKNACYSNTMAANGGRLPISSTNQSLLTLEQVRTNIYSSGIDTNKLYITLNDMVTKWLDNGDNDIQPYSEYCAGPVCETDIWCLDSMQQFYDAAVYAKNYFIGFMIISVDFDDYDNSCGCGKYPVANTYIDGWTDQSLKFCEKIG